MSDWPAMPPAVNVMTSVMSSSWEGGYPWVTCHLCPRISHDVGAVGSKDEISNVSSPMPCSLLWSLVFGDMTVDVAVIGRRSSEGWLLASGADESDNTAESGDRLYLSLELIDVPYSGTLTSRPNSSFLEFEDPAAACSCSLAAMEVMGCLGGGL